MSDRSVEKKKKSESNVYLTAVSGINFGKGAKTKAVPSQLVMVSPRDLKRQTMKDEARKGDTKMLNKAIGIPTDKESAVTFADVSTNKIPAAGSMVDSETEAQDMVQYNHSDRGKKYESGG